MADTMYIAMWSNGVSSYIPLSSFMMLTSGLNVKFKSVSTLAGQLVAGPSLADHAAACDLVESCAYYMADCNEDLDSIEARISALERQRRQPEFGIEFSPEFD